MRAFCRALADRLGVPAVIGDADVPGRREDTSACRSKSRAPRAPAVSSARRWRRSSADRIAVAHTRDDQAETVILRLARGAGSSGLAAMAPRRDHLIRPLLDVTRAELQDFFARSNETWREDATNLDRTIPRNRVRHEVMPQLRAINAQADAALARAAEILRGDDEFLERLANAAFLRCVQTDGEQETVTLDRRRSLRSCQGAGAARRALCARNRQPVPFVWLRRG